MGDTAWGALITGSTAVIVVILTALFKKRPARVGAYDNVQEDLDSLRKEFRAYKKDQDAENDFNRRVILHLDNEVMDLRSKMASAGIAVPDRKPYPVRP